MVFKRLQEDIRAFMARDPAARSRLEVFLCYPGLHALLFHRLAHMLWRHRWYLLGRFVSHIGRMLTAIEIHPGAEIGRRFVIDHGTGVVIGETAVIGNDVTVYHGATLGGIAPSVDSASQANTKRHPTLENNVIVGSGAQILGNVTIGDGARVGANAVVTRDVPAGTTAVGIPARVVMPQDKSKPKQFEAYGQPVEGCPDPVLRTIEDLRGQVARLIERVDELEARQGFDADAPAPDAVKPAATGRS
ncbi:MAG: serine O-acetyltransferase [Rhodospirillales bacterium]